MKLISILLSLVFSQQLWAEYVDEAYSVEDAAGFVLDRECGGSGALVEEYEIDSDFDYATYHLEFENGWAVVTASQKPFPTRPYDEEDYYVSEYQCTEGLNPSLEEAPFAVREYVEDFLDADCDTLVDFSDLKVLKTLDSSVTDDGLYYEFTRSYDVFYGDQTIGEASVFGISKEDEDPVSEWNFSLTCPEQ